MAPRGSAEAFVFTPDTGGVWLVDKPAGWTSFDVVGKLRGAMRIAAGFKVKVGHAGTLDPLATGLLVLAYGPMTKRLPEITGQPKVYSGTVVLGSTTPSYDLETEPVPSGPWEHLNEQAITDAFALFTGEIEQRPPLYSAKRHQGERGYHLARGGSDVEMEPVKVSIDRITMTAIRGREVDFEVHVGKGTYIRSLAHDIGKVLGCGAYLGSLRRTRIGDFDIKDAALPSEWSQRIAPYPEQRRRDQ